jgi:tetratricopeptide (TPR) repeat protein
LRIKLAIALATSAREVILLAMKAAAQLLLAVLTITLPVAACAGDHQYDLLIDAASGALAAGDTTHAAELFEQAARIDDARPDAEIGMVRAYLQAGEYRKALAFATLVAGEHRGSNQAEAFLAWIEFIGGQKQFALKRLDAALAQSPDDPDLLEVRARIRAIAGAETYISSPTTRLALDPVVPPHMDMPDVNAMQARASGVVVANGSRVLTGAAAVASARGDLWVRNALGQMRPAVIEQADGPTGVAVLRLKEPFQPSASIDAWQTARVFSGAPCYVVAFPALGLNDPAWPVLSAGLLGRIGALPGTMELTMKLPVGARGGAAFDSSGRLIGLVVPPGAAADMKPDAIGQTERLVLAPALQALVPAALREASRVNAETGLPRLSIQEIYELALPGVVTVLSVNPAFRAGEKKPHQRVRSIDTALQTAVGTVRATE